MNEPAMIEAHFSGLASQSTIYGLMFLPTRTGPYRVLTASSKRKVYCLEYSRCNKKLIPSTREVHFTYIPSAAEIISIDAFNQACHENDFVVGITFVKGNSSGKKSQYFNIYSDWKPSSECDLDNIAQGCLSLPLDFIPFQLTHTEITDNGTKEIVWLLSGNDNKVHLYQEDKSRQSFSEEPIESFFPELQNLNSVVFWMDFVVSGDTRVTAFGCSNGKVCLAVVDSSAGAKITHSWSIEHDCPIACVRFFVDHEPNAPLNFNSYNQTAISDCINLEQPLHLLVANTLETSVVYRDVLKKGLSLGTQYLLPTSNNYDCVTCCNVADINMDGQNELLLGTYGQQLLGYKWVPQSADSKGCYSLFYEHSFPNPLVSVAYLDVIGDGMKELLVLTTKGLHIFQHDPEKTVALCTQRLKTFVER